MENTADLFFDVQNKTDKQHVLDAPDTYIGSIECIDSLQRIVVENQVESNDQSNDQSNPCKKIEEKMISYIPGLYKLFDEAAVNCRDHVVRMKQKVDDNVPNALPVSFINFEISPDGVITTHNDGNGCDVAQKDGVWMPELLFAHLRTSTNFNKDEKRIVGGKNGYGFKLVLCWSSYGRLETVDHVRKLRYVQEYRNNLDIIGEPIITPVNSQNVKPYTKLTFKPDYARFQINGLSPDILALFEKRIYDISVMTDKSVKVRYNGQLIPVRNFEQYIDMYTDAERCYERPQTEFKGQTSNDSRWEYAVAISPNSEFAHVSFVNGICTGGGKHVDYILDQIVEKMIAYILKRKKQTVSKNSIKEQLILFLRCDIDNPVFGGQTKDVMNTPPSKFGSSCTVSDKFIDKLAKMGIMERAIGLTTLREATVQANKTPKTKPKTIIGIPKLEDAKWAGTDKSHLCCLILCEGDSAKSGIISGLSGENKNIYGVYPLKGKLLNVRGETSAKIRDNKEIDEIIKIMALTVGKTYSAADVKTHLRYGRIMIMTDQDTDGSHIKGLCINLIACMWPSLLEIPGFLEFQNTPILKATHLKKTIPFYSQGEFELWKKQNPTTFGRWKLKYYKGLGTSGKDEWKEYFAFPKIVQFVEPDLDAVDMVFNKKRADDRKAWLKTYDRNVFLDTSKLTVKYKEFINQEFIAFSKYDCDRSIPNLVDGLKISQRKILFSAFKRNLVSEIKVAQFSGYISEQSEYHHGEASLNQAIVGMAQDFVGSNNVNLLLPNGQFGTRLLGGKDVASPRYIFTALNPVARAVFPLADDQILTYLEEDGKSIEPVFYAPIVPLVLVNGASGIGTGFSTDIPCFNILDIIRYLRLKLDPLNTETDIDFVPFYRGFQGTIAEISKTKFLIKGVYTKLDDDTVLVSELPIGYWTADFKAHLEYWMNPMLFEKEEAKENKKNGKENKEKEKDIKVLEPMIKEFDDISADASVEVRYRIKFVKGKLAELESLDNGVYKFLKLCSTCSTTNMHLFDSHEKLQKYDRVQDIIDAFYPVRLDLYEKRRQKMLQVLEHEVAVRDNKVKYIGENIAGIIDLRMKDEDEIDDLLQEREYLKIDDSYRYLTDMPMRSVMVSVKTRLEAEAREKREELDYVRNTGAEKMWLNELTNLEDIIQKEEQKITIINPDKIAKKRPIKKAPKNAEV